MNPLTRVNYACHEAGHIAAACSRGIPCDASLEAFTVELGSASAMTYHDGGTDDDYLFILCGGLAASKLFALGGAGCLQDIRDIELLTTDEAKILRAKQEAERLVAANKDALVKLAFVLSDQGALSQAETLGIYSGQIEVTVPSEFMDAMQEVAETVWRIPTR